MQIRLSPPPLFSPLLMVFFTLSSLSLQALLLLLPSSFFLFLLLLLDRLFPAEERPSSRLLCLPSAPLRKKAARLQKALCVAVINTLDLVLSLTPPPPPRPPPPSFTECCTYSTRGKLKKLHILSLLRLFQYCLRKQWFDIEATIPTEGRSLIVLVGNTSSTHSSPFPSSSRKFHSISISLEEKRPQREEEEKGEGRSLQPRLRLPQGEEEGFLPPPCHGSNSENSSSKKVFVGMAFVVHRKRRERREEEEEARQAQE